MLTKNQFIILGAIVLIVLFFILGLLGIIPIFKTRTNGPSGPTSQIVLNFWGIDSYESFKPLFDIFSQTNQGIKIEYRQIDEKNYENTLLNAMAVSKGPDIFMFHRSWLPRQGDKVVPVDDSQFSLYNLRQLFPDVVEKDFASNNKIYALPLYLDSLALFYNKDIFNAKSIAITPSTWNDFGNLIPVLTQFDFSRQIKKSAAAIGGSGKSIKNAPDLLALLMLQYGSQFIDSRTEKISFDEASFKAFNFYLQFSNSSDSHYTWSDNFADSIDAFSSGDAAMIFDYSRRIPNIKQKNPFLNFAVAPMPQFDVSRPVNYADYWGLAVSNKSQYPKYAWEFILSAVADPKNSAMYLKNSNLPPALRSLINQYLSDPDLNAFARQSLTSVSMYQFNNGVFAQSFSNMIDLVLSGRATIQNALEQTQNEINGN